MFWFASWLLSAVNQEVICFYIKHKLLKNKILNLNIKSIKKLFMEFEKSCFELMNSAYFYKWSMPKWLRPLVNIKYKLKHLRLHNTIIKIQFWDVCYYIFAKFSFQFLTHWLALSCPELIGLLKQFLFHYKNLVNTILVEPLQLALMPVIKIIVSVKYIHSNFPSNFSWQYYDYLLISILPKSSYALLS